MPATKIPCHLSVAQSPDASQQDLAQAMEQCDEVTKEKVPIDKPMPMLEEPTRQTPASASAEESNPELLTGDEDILDQLMSEAPPLQEAMIEKSTSEQPSAEQTPMLGQAVLNNSTTMGSTPELPTHEKLVPEQSISGTSTLDVSTPEALNSEQPAFQQPMPEEPMPQEPTAEELKAAMDEEMIDHQRTQLRKHMGLPARIGGPAPAQPENKAYFFIETAAGRAKCKLMTCEHLIEPGRYRVALTPSMSSDHWTQGRVGTVGTFLEMPTRACLVTIM